MKLLDRKQTVFIFGLAIILITINFVISIYSTIHLLSIPDYVSNSHLVIYDLEATKSELKEAENTANSYTITGDDDYLIPYNNSITHINNHLSEVRKAIDDIANVKGKIDTLSQKVADKIKDLNNAITIRQEDDDYVAAEEFLSSDDLKQDTEDIDAQIKYLQAYEKDLYETLDAHVKEAKNRAIRTFIIAVSSMAVLLFIVYFQFIEREQKIRTEKAKREIENRFQTIIEHSSDVIMLVEADGKLLYVGPSITDHLGYSVDESYGLLVFDLIHKQEQFKARRLFKEMLDKPGDLFPFLFRIVHKDTSWSWMEGVAVNLINNLNLKAIVLNLRDVSERIKYEEELNQSKVEIENLYNHAPCGYYSINKDFVFVKINDTMLSWIGHTRDEVIGKMKITDLIHPTYLPMIFSSIDTFIKQGYIKNLKFDIVRKDGGTLPVLLNSTIIHDGNGNIVVTRSTLIDNTKYRGETTG
ncbi:MAG: PAS domain S-box protein [Bacteroidota bacterium]